MEQAQALAWSDSFAVGHDELDAQHRGLVDAINAVEAAVRQRQGPAPLSRALTALREAAAEHIRRENALLWEIGTGTHEALKGRARTPHFLKAMAEAAFEEHVAKHDELLARLDAILVGPAEALTEALKTWFVDHAIKHDLHLKAIFQAV